MAVAADLFGAVPLEEGVGWPPDSCGGGECAEALLAALGLVMEGPAQADEGKNDKEEHLDDLRSVRHICVEGQGSIHAEQEGQQQSQ